MTRAIFISLPVADVARSTAFYEAIGFEKNMQFSNEHASSMMWSDAISINVLDKGFYATLTPKRIIDAHTRSGVLIAFPLDSKEAVDAITRAAVAAGGGDEHGAEDLGFMYSRAFTDPDGHGFGPFWMDVDAAAGALAPATDD
ncbi:VOC family protein [uncultured Sphingomonas sp.]|uniref:VOC family protein n=1 Tax=uncultured Sphingomonas sp. TaxID=158754 RepID=UPI0035CC7B66